MPVRNLENYPSGSAYIVAYQSHLGHDAKHTVSTPEDGIQELSGEYFPYENWIYSSEKHLPHEQGFQVNQCRYCGHDLTLSEDREHHKFLGCGAPQ